MSMIEEHSPRICPHCNQALYAGATHWCPGLGRSDGAASLNPLTEADVRRIVDEELQRRGYIANGFSVAQTPICPKCGKLDVRIPRLGIFHVCSQDAVGGDE